MSSSKAAAITIGEDVIKFKVEMQDYNDFVNAMASGGDKIAPSYNFCVDTVVEEDEETLREHLKGWGTPVKVAGLLFNEVQDTVVVSAKKRKTGQAPSKTTS